jgi:SAM-dependent methyltransferase
MSKSPKDLAFKIHRDYYQKGSYGLDRYIWTITTFLKGCSDKRILEIGCGDGSLLLLLQSQSQNNVLYGVDISESGIQKCKEKNINAYLVDVSTEPLPFPDNFFDIVICLETLEHLMNPYFAMMEIRRVLKEKGRLICSVPNPLTGHPYLYPGLFEFKFFCRFLQQCGFRIVQIEPWEWAPRETILPSSLRRFRFLRSRYVAGVIRRVIERIWRMMGFFPWFCYWLWTFECVIEDKNLPLPLEVQANETKPQE